MPRLEDIWANRNQEDFLFQEGSCQKTSLLCYAYAPSSSITQKTILHTPSTSLKFAYCKKKVILNFYCYYFGTKAEVVSAYPKCVNLSRHVKSL